MDDLLTKEFVPCVVVYDDPQRTEMVLRDCATAWIEDSSGPDLGYDMEGGDLVAIRVYGDVSRREHVWSRNADLAAARRALAEFEKSGGTTLEELKRELGL